MVQIYSGFNKALLDTSWNWQYKKSYNPEYDKVEEFGVAGKV